MTILGILLDAEKIKIHNSQDTHRLIENTVIENGLEDMRRGEGKLGQSESGMDIYTLPNVK